MSRSVERYSAVEARIIGHRAEPQSPLGLLVSRVVNNGNTNITTEPFYAFTSRVVEKLRGLDVVLNGNIIIPCERLSSERRDELVVVRIYPPRSRILPIVELQSLLGQR